MWCEGSGGSTDVITDQNFVIAREIETIVLFQLLGEMNVLFSPSLSHLPTNQVNSSLKRGNKILA